MKRRETERKHNGVVDAYNIISCRRDGRGGKTVFDCRARQCSHLAKRVVIATWTPQSRRLSFLRISARFLPIVANCDPIFEINSCLSL